MMPQPVTSSMSSTPRYLLLRASWPKALPVVLPTVLKLLGIVLIHNLNQATCLYQRLKCTSEYWGAKAAGESSFSPCLHHVVTACSAFGVLLAPTVSCTMTATLVLWSWRLGPDLSVPNLKIGHCMSSLSAGNLSKLLTQ